MRAADKSKIHMYNTGAAIKKKLSIQQRRKKIIALIQNDPGIKQAEIAKKLGTTRGTVGRDIKQMSEEIKYENTDSFLVQRDRVLAELHQKKAICEDRMQRLSAHPHQGSRWMEEWQKLLDKEAKILGVYSPDRLLIKDEQTFNKEQEDASIDAMLKSVGAQNDIIDLIPVKKSSPKLPAPPVDKKLPEKETLD